MPAKSPLAALEDAVSGARDTDAPLNDRLAMVAEEVRDRTPEFAAAVDRLVARLQSVNAGSGAPKVGDRMPPFVLPDHAGNLIDLDSLLGAGPVAVTFRRGFWCPYCRLSTAALVDAHSRATAFGGQFVIVTPDRQEFSSKLRSEFGADFPVLTDIDNGYALSLNLVIWVGAEMVKMLAARGRDLPRYHANKAWMLPIPATFVVRTDGLIKARHVDPDYRKRMEIEELLDALRSAG